MLADLTHPIALLWAGDTPNFIGDMMACSRATVEPSYELRTSVGAVGAFTKLPVRWFQRANTAGQIEVEIPNLKTVSIERGIDVDAGTCTIVLSNQKMENPADPAGELGNPGYFTWSRGQEEAATNRWGHVANEWADVLVPNALIRTWGGYGGHDKTIAEAVADGNIVPTGTWLVDEVLPSARVGTITLKCRDMMKLAIDQPVITPLVPEKDTLGNALWPLRYCRFYEFPGTQTQLIKYGQLYPELDRRIVGFANVPTPPSGVGEGYWVAGDDGGVYGYGYMLLYGSASDTPLNSPVVGIARTADNKGYWLVAADGGVFSFGSADYFGSLPDSLIVPNQPVVGIERSAGGAGYFIVARDGGVWAFGDAVDEGNAVGTADGPIVGMAVHPSSGYWLLANTGSVFSFGATGHGADSGFTDWVAMEGTPSGGGYYTVRSDGSVYAHGDAVYQGGAEAILLNDPICDIAVRETGVGYWLCAQDGGVFTYGAGVPFYGSLPGPWVNRLTTPGNIDDWGTLIKELALWTGWWLNDGGVAANVYGNIESTGAFPSECLPSTFLDKQPVVDVFNKVKAVVGYVMWAGPEGDLNSS